MSEFWERTLSSIKAKGYTREYVASQIPVRPDVFSRWVQRDTIPRADKVFIIAKTIGVSVEFLMTGEKPEDKSLSDIRRKFHKWVDSMEEDELQSIVELFEVFDGIGKKLGTGDPVKYSRVEDISTLKVAESPDTTYGKKSGE